MGGSPVSTNSRHRSSLFVITVDTEEDGLWSGSYRRDGHRTDNIAHLPGLSRMLDEYGLKGTYLVTYPVAMDPACRGIIGEVVARGRGEVGSHLHSWCCPPFSELENRLPPYPHSLPAELQRRKLETLTSAIAGAFGQSPVSYRAGRWGFAPSSLSALVSTGHRVDSSVVPGWWQRGRDAPSFARAPQNPYLLSDTDVCRPGAGPLLEVPLTTGFVGAALGVRSGARAVPPWLPGGRSLLKLAGFAILRPADYTAGELVKLTRQAMLERRPVLHLMLHSSEVAPGHSPYSRDLAARDRLLDRLRAVVEVALEAGVRPATLAEVETSFRETARETPTPRV